MNIGKLEELIEDYNNNKTTSFRKRKKLFTECISLSSLYLKQNNNNPRFKYVDFEDIDKNKISGIHYESTTDFSGVPYVYALNGEWVAVKNSRLIDHIAFLRDLDNWDNFDYLNLGGLQTLAAPILKSNEAPENLDIFVAPAIEEAINFIQNLKKLRIVDISKLNMEVILPVKTSIGQDFLARENLFSRLKNNDLEKSIEYLKLNDTEFTSFNFIQGYKKLKSLLLGGCSNLEDFAVLNSAEFRDTLETLNLSRTNFKNLDSILNYGIIDLNLSNTQVDNWSLLEDAKMFCTLKKFNLQGSNFDNLKYLRDYSVLEELNIRKLGSGEKDILDTFMMDFEYGCLDGAKFSKTLKVLKLDLLDTNDLDHFLGYEALEEIEIGSGNSSTYEDPYTTLDESLTLPNLERNLKKLVSGLSVDLESVVDYENLEHFECGNRVYNFSSFRKMKAICGSLPTLKFVDVSQSYIDWRNPENGKTVQWLKNKNVEVKLPQDYTSFQQKYPADELINYITRQLTDAGIRQKDIDGVGKYLESSIQQFIDDKERLSPLMYEDKIGRVAKKIHVFPGHIVIKTTAEGNYDKEFSVYSTDLGEFDKYKADLVVKDEIKNDKLSLGVLIMEDLNCKDPKFKNSRSKREDVLMEFGKSALNKEEDLIKSRMKYVVGTTKSRIGDTISLQNYLQQEGADGLYDYLDHFMYTLALFHSQDHSKLNLGSPIHNTKIGETYFDPIFDNPNSEFNYHLEQSSLIRDNGLVHEMQAMFKENVYCPVVGDFKKNNTVKGYVIDFDKVRLGNPLEDIVKFLEQHDFQLRDNEKQHFVKKYLVFRDAINPLNDEQKNHISTNYNNHRFYENLRVLSGKCCWDQNFNDQYNVDKVIFSMYNAVQAQKQINL